MGYKGIVERMPKLVSNSYNWTIVSATGEGHVEVVDWMLKLAANY